MIFNVSGVTLKLVRRKKKSYKLNKFDFTRKDSSRFVWNSFVMDVAEDIRSTTLHAKELNL